MRRGSRKAAPFYWSRRQDRFQVHCSRSMSLIAIFVNGLIGEMHVNEQEQAVQTATPNWICEG